MLKFGKHKDWSTQQVYLIQELIEMMPVSQSLQAPLHLLAGPGQKLTISSLAALVQVNHLEMMASAAARDALARSQAIGTDAALSTNLLSVVNTLLTAFTGNPAAALASTQQQIMGCQNQVFQLMGAVQKLGTATQQADIELQGVVEKVATRSKLLSSDVHTDVSGAAPGGFSAATGGIADDRSDARSQAASQYNHGAGFGHSSCSFFGASGFQASGPPAPAVEGFVGASDAGLTSGSGSKGQEKESKQEVKLTCNEVCGGKCYQPSDDRIRFSGDRISAFKRSDDQLSSAQDDRLTIFRRSHQPFQTIRRSAQLRSDDRLTIFRRSHQLFQTIRRSEKLSADDRLTIFRRSHQLFRQV
jgi:hypothetical protein